MLRLATINGYKGLRTLTRAAGFAFDSSHQPLNLGELHAHVGIGADQLLALANRPLRGERKVTFGQTTVSVYDLTRGHPKLCGKCLDETGFVPSLWDLRCYVACHVHGLYLRDRCSSCGAGHSWSRHNLYACNCGAALTKAVQRRARKPSLAVAERLVALAAGETRDAPAVDLATYSKLVWFFGIAPRDESWEALFKSRKDFERAIKIVERGHGMLAEWPEAFHEWMRHLRIVPKGRTGLEAEFGPIIRRMHDAFRGTPGEFVLTELEWYLSTCWENVHCLKPRSFKGPPQESPFTTATTVARDLGIAIKKVAELMKLKRLEGVETQAGQRTVVVVRKDSVEGCRSWLRSLIDREEVGRLMGVPIQEVKKLRQDQLLPRSYNFNSNVLYDPNDIEGFLGGLSRETSQANFKRLLPMRLAPKRLQTAKRRLVRAVVEGKLEAFRPHGARPTFDNLAIAMPPKGFQLSEAGTYLAGAVAAGRLLGHLKSEIVMDLVDRGYLSPSARSMNDLWPLFAEDDLEAFKRRYVAGGELARTLGMKRHELPTRLRSAGLKPIDLTAADDMFRTNIWDREQLAPFLDRSSLASHLLFGPLKLPTGTNYSAVGDDAGFHPPIDQLEWEALLPMIDEVRPKARQAGRPVGLKQALDAILWRHLNAAKWRCIPAELGSWSRAYQLWSAWRARGVWVELLSVVEASGVDSAFGRALRPMLEEAPPPKGTCGCPSHTPRAAH